MGRLLFSSNWETVISYSLIFFVSFPLSFSFGNPINFHCNDYVLSGATFFNLQKCPLCEDECPFFAVPLSLAALFGLHTYGFLHSISHFLLVTRCNFSPSISVWLRFVGFTLFSKFLLRELMLIFLCKAFDICNNYSESPMYFKFSVWVEVEVFWK